MSDRHTLIAFMAVLIAIVVLFCIASILLYFGRSVEAIGIGGVMTGLIGILGSFRPRSPSQEVQDVNVTNTPKDPVQTKEACKSQGERT